MGNVKILIVEDDPLIAEDIKGILEDNAMEVCGNLQNGEEVLAYARLTQPDLVLMDIRLEGEMDGVQAAQELWQELQIPCVYLTAHSDPETVRRAKQSYPVGYLIKPFSARELCIGVEIALNQRLFPPLLEVLGTSEYALLRNAVATAEAFPIFNLQQKPPRNGAPVFGFSDAEVLDALEESRGDLSADLLDMLCGFWLQRSESPMPIELSADDFLRLRGLQAQKSGSGRRGGYDAKWREQIAEHLQLLTQIWMPTKGQFTPLLEITPLNAPFHWQIKPGKRLSQALFAPFPQTALLSRKVLQYNPYRQDWEKRLARFLSQQWRENLDSTVTEPSVQVLLAEVGAEIDAKHPLRSKEHLERSLDTLMQDRVIENWKYATAATATIKKLTRPSLALWLKETVRIETPANILEQYAGLGKLSAQPKIPGEMSLAFIRQIRQEQDLSLMAAASEIGITHARLSQLERGDNPGPQTHKKIKAWVLKQF